LGITDKSYSKQFNFDPSAETNDKKIGSAKDADIILTASEEVEDQHAVLKLAEESPFAEITSMFKIENLSRFGVVIGRSKEFIMKPNTMEIFQIGNLLVQIGRY
jgi:hypothetical protein